MNLFDEFRELAGELAIEMMVPAKLVRVGGAYDPATDRKSRSKQVIACRAVMGARRVVAVNGVITNQTVARITVAAEAGDQLEIGGQTHTIASVEIIAPDGKPIMWVGVMK